MSVRRVDSASPPSRSAAILSPAIDILLVGGLSLLVFVPLLLSGRSDLVIVGVGAQAWLATLINMPHFMASYRLVYRNRDTILRHKWASLYVPAILLVTITIALWQAQESPWLVALLVLVSSAYLAWHYTGQVWGMMASHAYLAGTSFDKRERLLVRTSLRILLVWHFIWALVDPRLKIAERFGVMRSAYEWVGYGTVVAFVIGAIGLEMMRRRVGKLPPARTLVAWLAIFVWYAMMARDRRAIFWIQIAHALQYLAFPIRVEINRAAADKPSPSRLAGHMVLYAIALLVISVVVARIVPGPAMTIVANVFGEEPGRAAPILLLMFINIHHYFTDGVIWHISNPEVRQELFAHVPRSAPKTAAQKQRDRR